MYEVIYPNGINNVYQIVNGIMDGWVQRFSDDKSLLTLELNLAGTKKNDIELSIDEDIVNAKVDNINRKTLVPAKYKQRSATYEDGILLVNFEKKDKKKIIDVL